jgi:glycosyltransferase involved in cell wall biosynthesis
MNVVILTPIPFWHPGTQELVDGLKSAGLQVRALDIFHGRTIDEHGALREHKPAFLRGFFEKLYLRLFRNSLIAREIKDGDIVDIHFLEPAYGRYIEAIRRKDIKLITTLFGSDLFRTNDEQKRAQAPVFARSDAIVLSENMVAYFEEHFPGYEKKYRFNQYGSARIDLVAALDSPENKREFRRKYKIPDGKIVVSCGYNAKKEQQHLKLLDEIDKLGVSEKEKLFLLLSLTYGREDADYVAEVKRKAARLNIPHLFFEERLGDTEIAEIRIISDITINTQTTDALASTIKEAMVAGDVMLVGDWLPYGIYRNLGAFYLTSPLDRLSEKLEDILRNIDEYREKSRVNTKIIQNFASWNVLLKDWIKLYREI